MIIKIIKNLSLSSLCFLLLILLLEGILRVFFPIHLVGYDEAFVYDESIGSVFKPGIHYLETTDYLQEARTNKFGTLNFQESFNQYNKFIFTVGDSFTQGSGIPADSSYPFQLDLLLNFKGDAYTNEYAVINLAREAIGGLQVLLYIDRFSKFTPKVDYILYFACENDVLDDMKFKEGIKHKNIIDNSPYWGAWTEPLKFIKNDTEIGKRLFILTNQIITRSVSAQKKSESDTRTTGTKNNPPFPQAQLDIFLRFKDISQKMGAKLIISWTEYNPPNSQYQWLKAWAKENDIDFADWHPKIESVKKAIPDLPIHNPHSGGHYRSWVNHLIAQSFAEIISQKKP